MVKSHNAKPFVLIFEQRNASKLSIVSALQSESSPFRRQPAKTKTLYLHVRYSELCSTIPSWKERNRCSSSDRILVNRALLFACTFLVTCCTGCTVVGKHFGQMFASESQPLAPRRTSKKRKCVVSVNKATCPGLCKSSYVFHCLLSYEKSAFIFLLFFFVVVAFYC